MEIESHYVVCATGCAICHKTFSNDQGLKRHRMYAHKAEDGVRENASYCEKCGKKYPHPRALKKHINRVHEGRSSHNKPRTCSICNMSFQTYGLWKSHQIKVHFPEKYERQCQECGRQFSTPGLLRSHMRSHEAPQYKCSFCGNMFRKRSSLEAHERGHRGEKPFQCSLCTIGFTDKKGLSQHMKGAHKIAGPRGGRVGWSHGKKLKQSDA